MAVEVTAPLWPDAILVPIEDIDARPEDFPDIEYVDRAGFGVIAFPFRHGCDLCRQVEPCQCGPFRCLCTCGGCRA